MSLFHTSDRIFIAGGNGMAGASIHRALRRAGYGVHSSGDILCPTRSQLDLKNYSQVEKWFVEHSPDIVVMAAAKVGGIEANRSLPADFLLDNLQIQTNVIDIAFRTGVRRLLFLGSSCIYPKLAQQPIREEALLTDSLEPTNEWYAIAKISGIKLVEALRIQHGFDAIALMPTNLYGPHDNYHALHSHVLPALIRRFYEASRSGTSSVTCWGTGSPRREFLHVDDLGDACVFALENWSSLAPDAPLTSSGKPLGYLNVGTGVDITIKEVATMIAKQVGFNGEIDWDSTKPDGTPRKQLDVSRLNAMGWSPKISLQEGLSQTVQEFKNQYSSGVLRLSD